MSDKKGNNVIFSDEDYASRQHIAKIANSEVLTIIYEKVVSYFHMIYLMSIFWAIFLLRIIFELV